VREVRWGARTLVVDVVWCGDRRAAEAALRPVRSTDPALTLPHPHAHHRAFVLLPWLEVEPEAELEVAGHPRPIRELLAALDAAERDGVRRTDFTLRAASR
jgi:2-amino-4-hydroxy-6-hydroxymethyldihydropteridine diphosphokinase